MGRSVRVIPILLLRGRGLVKTRKFKDPTYIGDPINAIRIFNEKEVDELMLLDIEATVSGHGPNLEVIRSVAGECFMPLAYGGGVGSLSQIEAVLKIGVEKVSLNAALLEKPHFVRDAVREYGRSTIVGSIDYRRSLLGGAVPLIRSGSKRTNNSLVDYAKYAEQLGVGEIVLQSIDQDGAMTGYDIDAIKSVAEAVRVPVIAAGGAGSLAHMRAAVHEGGAAAVAAGAFFVYVGKHRAVLITYPTQKQLQGEVFV
jgi:cyclase